MTDLDHLSLHHLNIEPDHVVGNGSAGRIFLLPGSDGRAEQIATHLQDVTVLPSQRRLNVYLGRAEHEGLSADLAVVSTGMGCSSLDIVATELMSVGAKNFLRVGTSGSLQPTAIRAGSIVIATGAVRDEAVSDRYVCRGYPALADRHVVSACRAAARTLALEARTFCGIIHSKEALFAREFDMGPLAAENHDFMEALKSMPVLASEMEAAHLFILADVHGSQVLSLKAEAAGPAGRIRAGAVLAVIGDDRPFAPEDEAEAAETAVIELALAASVRLAHDLQRTTP
ncbi:MAG: uridine phosphorylase [Deltaproteobacteria bacterium]|nr:uridine phosphorylase [Deltaproteobacteria bacterium]